MKTQTFLVPEDQLLRRLNKRDEQAFQWLYDQYAHVLYGVVLTSVRLPDLAQQVVEEVFVKAWDEFDQFNPKKTRLLTWLLSRARREALCVLPKQLPELLPAIDYEVVENLITEEQRTLLDAVYFRGEITTGTDNSTAADDTLRRHLQTILQDLKRVFTQ